MARSSQDSPRILIVTGVLWIGGGAEKVAATLGNYLTDQGYETHLLTFYEAGEKYPYHGIYHSFKEPALGRLAKIPRIPLRIWRIYRYAKLHNIDIAYTFLEEANFYVVLAKLLFARKLRVIVSVRNNIRQRSTLFKKLSGWLYPHAQCVVSVTRTVETMLKEDFNLQNTTTIYNPLDMQMIENKQSEPLLTEYTWLDDKTPLLISMGRLIRQKGQWHLLRAFTTVVQSHPDATLVILGEGEYQSKLQQLIKDCGLEKNVFLLGKHSNVYQFLAAADFFVFSSLWEGMPNTMLEALSVGLPIVTPDCPSGPREIIAPSLSVTDTPTYPLKTQYGVLTTPFSTSINEIWSSPKQIPLIAEETQLATAIKDTIISGWRRGAAYTAYQTQIKQSFDYQNIMQQWERLL